MSEHALQVYEMLDEMRIGTLPEKDRITASSDPYSNDPKRNASIAPHSTTPFNGESPMSALLSFITPTELHFKRNHLPVPQALPEAYELQVCACGGKRTQLHCHRGHWFCRILCSIITSTVPSNM